MLILLAVLWSASAQVYLAGPLFNHRERVEMQEIADALNAEGTATFLPQRDGFLLENLRPYLIEHHGLSPEAAAELGSRAVYALDVYMVIRGTRALVLNLNGRVPDEGTLVEAAMAVMAGHPVVAYRDDVRTLVGGIINPLVAGLTDFVEVSKIPAIPAALRARPVAQPFEPPPHLRPTLEMGEKL